jgi:hypothetical protein
VSAQPESHGYDGSLHVVYQYDTECSCRGSGVHEDDVSCGSWVIDGGEPTVSQLAGMLRTHAAGEPGWEASVELLIAHGHWLRVARLRPYIDAYLGYGRRSSRQPDVPMAHFDWPMIGQALDEYRLSGSTSEMAILRIAGSLASFAIEVNLRDALSGLDRTNARLVAQAVAHSAGPRQDWT